MWRGRLLPEVEEQLESSRILGSSHYRSNIPPSDSVVLPTPTKDPNGKRNRRDKRDKVVRTQTGGATPAVKPNEVQSITGQPGAYPLGRRLRSVEFDASKKHCPRDSKSGKTLCWNFNTNAGCSTASENCPFGLHRRIKPGGLHWTVSAQIARRGGFKGAKLLNDTEIDGFVTSLREADALKSDAKRERQPAPAGQKTGGYSGQCEADISTDTTSSFLTPPGLDSPLGARPL